MNDSHLTSTNLIDKVVYKSSNSRVVNQASTQSDSVIVTIPHELKFIPHCIGIFGDTSNFNPSYEFDQPPYDYVSAMAAYGPDLEASVRSDLYNIYVYLRNWRTTRRMYYRVVGIIPPEVTEAPALLLGQRDDTLLNSEDNFLKIWMDDYVDVVIPAFGTVDVTPITHGLGYRPMVVSYIQFPPNDPFTPGLTFRTGTENVFGYDGIFSRMTIDETQVYFTLSADFDATLRVFYKVYLDA